MKKKNLKSLSLHKNTISKLNAIQVLGGINNLEEEGSGVEGCQGMATRTACSTAC
ncbi:class I lanthipeptide [uncultured Dokdonia sp.]|uniref:class I lanthipeptide n=1 Tax=uncultured Dokdonia sp. TaxID=575653 RepID=UPI0026358A6C|nr:class I lanthipeptide [uncultured Dokdonia sp.]